MAYVTSKEILMQAQRDGYAVGAFNAENMEMVKAIIAAAEELRAPVIIQTTPSTVTYGGIAMYAAMAAAEAEKAAVPVSLHLDHGDQLKLVQEALETGYTSVMIDGSGLDFEANIEITKTAVGYARKKGVPVEAELGKVGGKEDGLEVSADTKTDPARAAEFAAATGVDSLAVAIGTAHGFYQGVPVLDKVRLARIRQAVSIPLVLHGASGLSDQEVQECIGHGICKVNFATELRVAYTGAVRGLLDKEPELFDPKKFGAAGMTAVKELVKNRIRVCGCGA